MTSLRTNFGLAASLAVAACLGAAGAHATPILTTHAEHSVWDAQEIPPVAPTTVSDISPPSGRALNSQLTSSGATSLCSIQGNCAPGQLSVGHATAAQNETMLGVSSALEADGTFFVGGPSANNSVLARTAWQDSPTAAGPMSITLSIKPGVLILSDFASAQFGNATQARFRIELRVNGNVVFFSEAVLAGGAGGPTLTETGTNLVATAVIDPDYPNNVFGYRFDALLTTINLGNLSPTDVVLYTMEVSVNGPGLETGGYARIGDPFDLTTGGSSIAFSVPEPNVALMLGVFGALALAFWREREKQRSQRR